MLDLIRDIARKGLNYLDKGRLNGDGKSHSARLCFN